MNWKMSFSGKWHTGWGRKFKIRMPVVMQRFKEGNTFASENRRLLQPTKFPSLQYRQRFFKPNPYLNRKRDSVEKTSRLSPTGLGMKLVLVWPTYVGPY